ncbi:hypothetical protein BP5796_06828 [Coleophoma crateriformis]|uniref:Zn(2)-C6 fungal-type domain-containing protein n=1 Tax=Coleophoma crateriformis TaxID=565419 RepID=A0A3D8RPK6_9HELO|nr:hypothetical protein BP5796_06828 [Coleophoma crateriformis]
MDPEQGSTQKLRDSSSYLPESGSRGGIRVSLACLPCRSRHVKCGAETPSCVRCIDDGKACVYAKSRRGLRDKSSSSKRLAVKGASNDDQNVDNAPAMDHEQYGSKMAGSSYRSYSGPLSESSMSPSSISSKQSTRPATTERLLELYYLCFHNAHPFLLPQNYFFARLGSDPVSLQHLLPVMWYIGSVHTEHGRSAVLRERMLQQVDLQDLPPNGFTVQAFLITALVLQAEDEMDRARNLLDRAIFLALQIGLHTKAYSSIETDAVLAECWRRTYWGCYIADCCFAIFLRAPTFMLWSVQSDVELPSEEFEYEREMVPPPRTLTEYDMRDFDEEPIVYSSFAYLIDLVRISGSILYMNGMSGADLELAVENADAMLVNWQFHMPKEKRGIIDINEDVDEVLFGAYSLFHTLQIYLHRPLSRLYLSPLENPAHKAPNMPKQEVSTEAYALWQHTRKTLNAVNALLSLYKLPSTLSHHSPILVDAIRLAILAQLSVCTYSEREDELRNGRQRVRLALGCLKGFGEVWPLGARLEREMKSISRNVFGLSKNSHATNLLSKTASPSFDLALIKQSPDPSQDLAPMIEQDIGIYDEYADMDYLITLSGIAQGSL